MAITITDSPGTYASLHDDLWFVSSSTNSGTTNFKFVYDVRVNGNIVSTVKVFPDPSGGYGIFNASPIVGHMLQTILNPQVVLFWFPLMTN